MPSGLGQATINRLIANNFDPRELRPYIGKDGETSYVDRLNPITNLYEAKPVNNAYASLRKDEWIHLDRAIVQASGPRLRILDTLRANGQVFNLPNGMASTILQSQAITRTGPAQTSMDGLRKSNDDRVEYTLDSIPLPIIHKDFSFSARELMVARQTGAGLDVSTAQAAARSVAEDIEQKLTGTSAVYSAGGGSLYGLINFPNRITKSMTLPTASGYTPATTVREVIDMRTKSRDAFHYGDWTLYVSQGWEAIMDEDYSGAKGDNTLRERLAQIDGIKSIVTLDYLTGYQMVLVQNTQDVFRAVQGLDISTLQWESQGGMEINFKVMAIIVPQARKDAYDRTGIVHGVAA